MSVDLLREEHESLQRAVQASRRAFVATPLSAFVREMQKAIDGYLEMRQQGVSREDACKGLELVLRAAWPKKPSKFSALCDACDDTGWRMRSCTHAMRCQRRRCQDAHPADEHTYAERCECAAWDRFKRRPGDVEDEIAAAGRVSKPKPSGWSPLGR